MINPRYQAGVELKKAVASLSNYKFLQDPAQFFSGYKSAKFSRADYDGLSNF